MGRQNSSFSKDKFSRWFKNKKKSPSEKNVGPPRKSKGKGKGKEGKDSGAKGKGKDKGKEGKGKGEAADRPSFSLNTDDMGKAGVSRLCTRLPFCQRPHPNAFFFGDLKARDSCKPHMNQMHPNASAISLCA